METNDIKDIWKTGIDENIKSYSEAELSDVIVKAARKSMKRMQPKGLFRIIIIAVIIYILIKLLIGTGSKSMDIFTLILLGGAYGWGEYNAWKMNKYKLDMPIKEWLEYRIKLIEKEIRFYKKYDLLIYTGSFILGSSFYISPYIIMKIPFNIPLIGIFSVGLVIYILIIRYSIDKNYKKTLNELNELYSQLEE